MDANKILAGLLNFVQYENIDLRVVERITTDQLENGDVQVELEFDYGFEYFIVRN